MTAKKGSKHTVNCYVKITRTSTHSMQVYGGPSFNYLLHEVHSNFVPTHDSGVKWCEDRGYTVVDEKMARPFTSAKPTIPGAYWITGNGIEGKALVEVKALVDDKGNPELWCNLHARTTEENFNFGYAVDVLNDDFEFCGPLE